MSDTAEKIQDFIITLLKDSGSIDQLSGISPKEIFAACKKSGFGKQAVEQTIILMIDNDLVDYEMDENNQASEIWLMEA